MMELGAREKWENCCSNCCPCIHRPPCATTRQQNFIFQSPGSTAPGERVLAPLAALSGRDSFMCFLTRHQALPCHCRVLRARAAYEAEEKVPASQPASQRLRTLPRHYSDSTLCLTFIFRFFGLQLFDHRREREVTSRHVPKPPLSAFLLPVVDGFFHDTNIFRPCRFVRFSTAMHHFAYSAYYSTGTRGRAATGPPLMTVRTHTQRRTHTELWWKLVAECYVYKISFEYFNGRTAAAPCPFAEAIHGTRSVCSDAALLVLSLCLSPLERKQNASPWPWFVWRRNWRRNT